MRKSFVRGTNLVCATTKGIVSRGSGPVRDTDYAMLIVDEASRVTGSEFLIGAVRARRWVLVGDEYQLPPHVDGDDEHHLHALTAIHRAERGAAPTLEEAVSQLAGLWKEDEELHEFRNREVLRLAQQLVDSGDWVDGYRDTFTAAHRHFEGADADATLLKAMLRHLVHSLFQRTVPKARPELRQRLTTQRRMVPALARVVREPIYRGRYLDPEPAELVARGLHPITTPNFPTPVTFIDTSLYIGAHNERVGTGFVNALERQAVRWAIQTYDRDLVNRKVGGTVRVSVLSFYKAQAARLDQDIRKLKLRVLKPDVIDVIDAIQGQEADIVFLSFTRAVGHRPSQHFGQWLKDVRRLNVACTRARRALVLVGHSQTLKRLNGVEEANVFYEHLFSLFATDPEFQIKKRFK
ncbi:AAA domain-containing protein [Micromonospora matsumotoense]|uniref:AAA domain-containing protein n=1 Tax=Micromonospora matsumotoense TaxID=121616 RepID=UPI003D9340C5